MHKFHFPYALNYDKSFIIFLCDTLLGDLSYSETYFFLEFNLDFFFKFEWFWKAFHNIGMMYHFPFFAKVLKNIIFFNFSMEFEKIDKLS